MIIYYRDDAAWFEEGYEPSDDERRVLAQFTEALPDIPCAIQINNVCEYRLVDGGSNLDSHWVDYHFNVEELSSLPTRT